MSQAAPQGGPIFNGTYSAASNIIYGNGYNNDPVGNITSDGFHSYTYDAEGNMLTVDGGATATYTYDALNHRVRIDKGSTAVEFGFYQNGQRAEVWDGNTGAALKVQYYWGTQPLAYFTNDTHFQHQDWLGTERAQTSYNGALEATYSSLPFGDSFSDEGNDGVYQPATSYADAYHFAALDHDYETADDHAQFREYTHNQGRWLSPDRYAGSYDFSNPQTLNRYAYVGNNPLSFTDPSGLLDCKYPPCDPNGLGSGDGSNNGDGNGDNGNYGGYYAGGYNNPAVASYTMTINATYIFICPLCDMYLESQQVSTLT